jgi:hypothetical protein
VSPRHALPSLRGLFACEGRAGLQPARRAGAAALQRRWRERARAFVAVTDVGLAWPQRASTLAYAVAWRDLARVLLHGADGASPSGDVLEREAACLRKRFQILEQQLYELGRREGLIRDR